MAYASTNDLPADVLAAFPEEEARALILRVANLSLAAGDPADVAIAIAKRGASNARTSRAALVTKRRADGRYVFTAAVEKFDGTDDEVEVSGWASIAVNDKANVIIDHDGEEIPVAVLKSAAARFLQKSREFNAVDHYSAPCGYLTQSIVMDPATRVAMGQDGTGPIGWWVTAKIRGPAAKRVRSGELREFSIEATALKRKAPEGHVVFDSLEVDRITLVDAGAGIGVRIEAIKSLANGVKNMPTVEEVLTALNASDEQKQVIMLALEKAALSAKAEPAKPAEPAMSDEVRKRFDAEKAERESVAKRLADAEKQIADRDLADSKREFVAKASKLKHLAVPHDKLGEGLRLIAGVVAKDATSKDAIETVTKALELANEQLAKSALYVEHGSDRPPSDDSAQAKLDAKAREICTRDEDLKKMPVAKAMKIAKGRAYDENPDLYNQIQRGN